MTAMTAMIGNQIQRLRNFIADDIWDIDLRRLPRIRRSIYSFIKIISIVIKGFIDDKCALHASALTFITLMSTVPLLALIFSIAGGLGIQNTLKGGITKYDGIPEQVRNFLDGVVELVNDTNLMALGVIGLLLVFWTVIRLLGKIEGTFNSIWGVREGRTLVRKFSDYMSVLLFVPLMLLLFTTVNVTAFAGGRIDMFFYEFLGPIYIVYALVAVLASGFFIILAFTFLYLCLPNTKVRLSPALIGGLCCGIAWIAWQWACIQFQIGITNFNAIYGAFAGLPISLFWLHVNWMIVLFGAEVSFGFQHCETYTQEGELNEASFVTRKRLAYFIVHEVCRLFHRGSPAWRPQDFQRRHNIPIRLLQDVIFSLKQHGVLIEVEGGGHVPAKDLSALNLKDIELAIYGRPNKHIEKLDATLEGAVIHALEAKEEVYLESLAGINLNSLIAGPDDS